MAGQGWSKWLAAFVAQGIEKQIMLVGFQISHIAMG